MTRTSPLDRIALWATTASVILLTLCAPSAGAVPATAQAPARQVEEPEDRGSRRNHNHTATFNIQGGRNPENHDESDAEHWFNEDIARIGLQNTVQSRVIDRGVYLQGLAVQETCRAHWLNITLELRTWHVIDDNNVWALHERASPAFYDSPSTPLSAGCGAWFGLGTLIRGAIVASSGTTAYPSSIQYSERRVWICLETYFLLCNTHISNKQQVNKHQIDHYRSVATYLSALSPTISTFAAGDFNAQPHHYQDLWRLQWEFDGFWDADNALFQPTYRPTQTTIDYIWRSRPASFGYDAWVPQSGVSDHYWKQGYW